MPADPVLRSTRKLTAPPDASAQVERDLVSGDRRRGEVSGWRRNRVGVAPVQDILHGGQSAGGAGEPSERRGAAHGAGDIHRVRLRRRDVRGGVGDGDLQGRAVVGHEYVEYVAAVQVDARIAQVDGAHVGRGRAVEEKARRIGALALVVVKIEFHGHALRNPACPAGIGRPVAKTATAAAQRSQSRALKREREPVCNGIQQLKAELSDEAGDIDPVGGENAACLTGAAVGELQD